MKKLFTLLIVFCLPFVTYTQDLPDNLYLIVEMMHVPANQGTAYMEVEEFWSGIHKQRVANGSILGWDLWSLTPAGSEQGGQYMTVTLYSSMEAMFTGMNMDQIYAYAKQAHNVSDKEVDAMMEKTVASRDIMYQVYSRQIASTQNDPPMKEGMFVLIGFMKQNSADYVEVERNIFLPMHQQAVNNGEMMGWGLCENLLPIGTEAYSSHMTFNFYENQAKMSSWFEISYYNDMSAAMAANQGLTTREIKNVKIGQLVMMIR